MEPLSNRIRRAYLALFIVSFCAILPVVIFYADGWRYKSGYGFVRTGGIYLAVPYPDANVSINGEEIGRSGFLERSFYKGDLAPSAYIVHVEREGYLPWDRLLVVEEQLVTDSRILLIPEKVSAMPIIVATSTTVVSTTTRPVTAALFAEYTRIFTATTTASTTLPVDESNGSGLFLERGKLTMRWLQENAFPPSHFCDRPSVCVDEIVLASNSVVTARFFRGGIAYVTKEGVVHFIEADVRQKPIAAILYTAKGADIRVIDDSLFVRTANNLFELSL